MASLLYNYFLSCWINYTITDEQLQKAVSKGYITYDEYLTIINTPR